jgi:hypothetical protein
MLEYRNIILSDQYRSSLLGAIPTRVCTSQLAATVYTISDDEVTNGINES